MIGYYNYTVILTYIGMISGFMGITYVLNGNIKYALICLLISGFCDMFDGKIASTMKRTKQEKRFGIQIDSLSDLICFGALPALTVLKCTDGKLPYILISALYLLCALIRLAWFNVDEEERQTQEEGSRKVYLGLPVTSAALIIPFVIGVCCSLELPTGLISPAALLAVAIAFLTPFHLRKPKLIGKLVMVALGVAGVITVILGVNI